MKARRFLTLFLIIFVLVSFTTAGYSATDSVEADLTKTFGSLKTKVTPRPQDNKANQIAAKQAAGKNAPMPTEGRNGSVQFQFDSSTPRVWCKPLRVTDIELEPGESIVNAPFIGDSVNWSVLPSASGSGQNLTYHIIIKPTMPDLNTNMIVHTDRRTYQFDLVSSNKFYTPHVTFSYPANNETSWDSFFSAMGNNDPRRNLVQKEQEIYGTELPGGRPSSSSGKAVAPVVATPKANSRLNFNYRIVPKGKNIEWKPLRVYDNGLKTYIDMPDNLAAIEAPVFMLLSPAGSREMVNYRLVDRTYVVDRTIKRGVLIAGTGHEAREVVIVNMQKNAPAEISGAPAKKVLKTKEDLIKFLSGNDSAADSESEEE